jgi:F5/8 type C domain
MGGSAAGSTTAAGTSSGGSSAGGVGGGSSAGSASAGASGGGVGGAAGGTGGAGGAAGSAGASGGGAGGAACGSIDKASDGSYVRTGWTAEYTCTGADCPAKNQADTGDIGTNAFDGNFTSRWSTGVFQAALKQQNRFPLYFTVDLQKAVPVSKLTTHPGCKDIYDSPGTIEVLVSTDGTTFTTITPSPHTPAVPSNESCPPKANAVATDTITFPTTCARYIRLKGTQRTTSDRYWAIGEMLVFP